MPQVRSLLPNAQPGQLNRVGVPSLALHAPAKSDGSEHPQKTGVKELYQPKSFDIKDRTLAPGFGFEHCLYSASDADPGGIAHAEKEVKKKCRRAFQLHEGQCQRPLESVAVVVDETEGEAFENPFGLDLDLFRKLRKAALAELPRRQIDVTARSAAGADQLAALFQRLKEDLPAHARRIERLDRDLPGPGNCAAHCPGSWRPHARTALA